MENNIDFIINLNTDELYRIAIGSRLFDKFRWNYSEVNFEKIIKSDKETKDILIKEKDLMDIIELVNPGQKDRRIVLIKDD